MIVHGDCMDAMAGAGAGTFDAIVTDPPYGLPGGFMGKAWDRHDAREDAGFGYWLTGLIDGEGHFAIKRHTRGTHAPAFVLKLREDDRLILEFVRAQLAIGSVHVEPNQPNPMVKWVVQSQEDCVRLVDVLDKYPLRAKKRHDFAIWREAVCEWVNQPRGNRWHGAADNGRMADLRQTLMAQRHYSPAWSGHEYQDWCRVWAAECLRVLKPGGHLLAFGGTRTIHRLIAGIEDAGFEIRDMLSWNFGSGFPKSHNLPGGLGTALKPGWEGITLARKPLAGTVAQNVLQHGTGAINVDGCRIGTGERPVMVRTDTVVAASSMSGESTGASSNGEMTTLGRWPANVVLDPQAAHMLDEQTGELTSGAHAPDEQRSMPGGNGRTHGVMTGVVGAWHGDTGGASRFYYCAKTSSAERNAGLDGFPLGDGRTMDGGHVVSEGRTAPKVGSPRANSHPTVKPIDLMRWLIRLVTPPGGIILDPFAGSGTTGIAAHLEGFRFIGVESDADYAAIARARIAWWERQPHGIELAEALAAEAGRERVRTTGQLEFET